MITQKDFMADYKRNSSHKKCFYYDKSTCKGKIKKAHSIQKEKILSQLEENVNNNNVVYSFDHFTDKNELVPLGKNSATIFTGFCDYHDSKVFSPIENFDLSLSNEQLFLFTYRAFAYSFHQIVEQFNYMRSNGKVIQMMPKQLILAEQALTSHWLKKYLVYKKILDDLIAHKDYSGLRYHFRVFKPFLPLASSSVLSPTYTYKNVYLNPREEYSYVVLNVIPDKTRTIVLLANFNEDTKGKILFDELSTLTDQEFTAAISSLMVYCPANTIISPTLWDKFTQTMRNQLAEEFDFITMKGDKVTKFFKSRFDFFRM
jgi:hypothetical protein